MQQVKFKKGSMSEARYGNDATYYLNSLNGDTSIISGNGRPPRCVFTNELETVTPCVTLPCILSDNKIMGMWLNAGGTFSGVEATEDGNVTYYSMTEERIIKFIRSLL